MRRPARTVVAFMAFACLAYAETNFVKAQNGTSGACTPELQVKTRAVGKALGDVQRERGEDADDDSARRRGHSRTDFAATNFTTRSKRKECQPE